MNQYLEMYLQTPIVTRTYMTAIVIVAILCNFHQLTPLQLYFNYNLILRGEWWRLITNFLYFGPIGFDLIFHLFFLFRYCKMLEEESFHGRSSDFLVMLVFGAVIMVTVAPFLRSTFLGTSLTFMIVYVWSRRNPAVQMNFLGMFNFSAPFMPWVLSGFTFLLSGRLPVADLLGIICGHAYYYTQDVFPLLYGWRPLEAPYWVKRLCGEQIDFVPVNLHTAPDVAAPAQNEQFGEIAEELDRNNTIHHRNNVDKETLLDASNSEDSEETTDSHRDGPSVHKRKVPNK